jgi:hypothetical protein
MARSDPRVALRGSRIAEIAEMALSQAGPATARDLRQALDDAQG